MIKFFYDSLETLQKVKFATKKDYISLTFGVIFAILVGWVFFIGVDTIRSAAYKTLYTVLRSEHLQDSIYDGLDTSGAVSSWAVVSGTATTTSGATIDIAPVTVQTGSTS